MNTLQAAFAEMKAIFRAVERKKCRVMGLIVHSEARQQFIAGADVRMLCQAY